MAAPCNYVCERGSQSELSAVGRPWEPYRFPVLRNAGIKAVRAPSNLDPQSISMDWLYDLHVFKYVCVCAGSLSLNLDLTDLARVVNVQEYPVFTSHALGLQGVTMI